MARDGTGGISSLPAGGEGDRSAVVQAVPSRPGSQEKTSVRGRLNDVASQPAPPAPGSKTQRPLSHFPLPLFSPLSHPPLTLIQPGVPFALYGLLACSTATAPSMPPQP
ncbi:unnamed protein product [Pleuronectes platessa]|uniref:Uncharacterized protein n=1 Tax=Pleuronectes platessa TaxID=8262 RepID=A0A9N7Y5A7_PLEPL|nr:unnamed protein product [Pleuronectes platessa]